MRTSTTTKHLYQQQGIRVLRAIQDQGMIRLTVPAGTPNLQNQVHRMPAQQMIGGPSKTREWIWVLPKRSDDIAALEDPCNGRICTECEIGGCNNGVIEVWN